MPLLEISTFCINFNIRTGAKIIGILEIVFSLSSLVISAIIYGYLDHPNTEFHLPPEKKRLVYYLYMSTTIVSAFGVLFSIVLLFGVLRYISRNFVPWMLYVLVDIVQIISIGVINSIVFGEDVFSIPMTIITTVLKIYFAVVIYNHYKQVVEMEDYYRPFLENDIYLEFQ